MNQQSEPQRDDPQVPPAISEPPNDDAPARDEASRREFLIKSARRAAYVAPVVLLFHPKRACASNGSTLTYWYNGEIGTKPHTPGQYPGG